MAIQRYKLIDAQCPIAQIGAERVLVVARESVHDLLQMQAQVVARFVDRQMFRPAMAASAKIERNPRAWVATAPDPQMVKSTKDPITKPVYRPLRTARGWLPVFLLPPPTPPLLKSTPHA